MPGHVAEEDTILFGVPKKGRLHEEVMKLLNGAGLDATRPDRLDVARCNSLPVKLVFLPASDIPKYIMEGDVHIGISGGDMLEEAQLATSSSSSSSVDVKMKLGFGKCRLCVQAPKVLGVPDASFFLGKRIVTSFPNLTRQFFDNLGSKEHGTQIRVVSGSVEAACGLGLADAVVDLVETGTTMRAAGLEVVSEVVTTEALLMQQHRVSEGKLSAAMNETVNLIHERLRGYMTASRNVMIVYNCPEASLRACCDITPGKRSPTVTALSEKGWFSVSALVNKKESNSIMDKLQKAGAVDILCMNLSNTRM
eukprot:TRINITY_DN20354_c0_g1_i1.p1 TRINITY_DN20354_c0_g1~~TRINITY_DN20354_c0_g1_i1.p1  ORF type:complete len:352 (+),score=77.33 TRINITY_DN20354_c0_g1_i1:130-1056(+)